MSNSLPNALRTAPRRATPGEAPLAGQYAIVTAATRRIGSAIALRLAAQGASLFLHYRSDEQGRRLTSERLDALGATYAWHQADLGDNAACVALVDAALGRFGGIDILVNNAAMFRRTPLDAMTIEDFDLHMRVNARSVYALSLHAGRHMKARGRGAIVNIADISGTRPWGSHVPYCASKAAVISLTRGFARALAPEVRVNAVSPGSAIPPEDAAQGSGIKDSLIPGHSGAAAIAAAVDLCLRAGYVTGVDLVVDGGRSLIEMGLGPV